jgi:small-conductance mechanosensitive channel
MDVERIVVAVVIVAVGLIAAWTVDRLLRRRRDLPPAALTRYRAIRRTIYVLIVGISIGAAALTFPSVKGAASALLTSAAVVAVIVGIAAQSSLGNFISGLVMAFSQPIRIGDQIEFRGVAGVVEDVGRIYTRVRTRDGAWLQVPNNLLASDTIRNWTIVNPECTAHVRVLLPLSADLGNAMEILLGEARAAAGVQTGREPSVRVSDLGGDTVELTVEVWIPHHSVAEEVSANLRLRIHERLRAAGVLA